MIPFLRKLDGLIDCFIIFTFPYSLVHLVVWQWYCIWIFWCSPHTLGMPRATMSLCFKFSTFPSSCVYYLTTIVICVVFTMLNKSKWFRCSREKKRENYTGNPETTRNKYWCHESTNNNASAFQLTLFIFCFKILCFYGHIAQNCIFVNLC